MYTRPGKARDGARTAAMEMTEQNPHLKTFIANVRRTKS